MDYKDIQVTINDDIQKGSDIIEKEAKLIDDGINQIKDPKTSLGTKLSVILGILVGIASFVFSVYVLVKDIREDIKPLIKHVIGVVVSTSQPNQSK